MPFVRIPNPNQFKTLGLAYNDKYHVYLWDDPQRQAGRVLFSVCRQGSALMCHFAADTKALRHIRRGMAEFYVYLQHRYPHRMVLAYVLRSSVMRLLDRMPQQCTPILETPQGQIYRFHF